MKHTTEFIESQVNWGNLVNPIPVMEDTKKDTSIIICASNNIIEVSEFDKEDLWRPNCPLIQINPEKADFRYPQVWNIEDLWFYNWTWALLEAQYLDKTLPHPLDWYKLIRSIDSTIIYKSIWQSNTSVKDTLWLKLWWLYWSRTDKLFCCWEEGYYWTSTRGCSLQINKTWILPIADWISCNWMLVRLIDKKPN